MDDKTRKQDAQQKFLAFLLTTSGGDITAPEPLLEQEVAQFKEVKRVSENDEVVDALVAVARTDSQQERLEIIEILSMKLLTLTQILKLQTFLHDYVTHTMEYLKDHPEARDPDVEGKAMRSIEDMFGF